ncbi:MAG: GNAT family N-acetyltransferase, partial [Planctomycetales bacterium]|nr:GNAT family N-acetyltransferase [Planctomycetales bacterium]
AAALIEYRTFRNNDPPKILGLWHQAGFGSGAAQGFSCDAFDLLVFAQPYFDKRGLIVAEVDGEAVGFVHAGFGSNVEGSQLDRGRGVISAIVVHPAHRRKGIARELVTRAESYLREQGVTEFQAGEASSLTPFYLGLYGSSDCVGFLESDHTAAPFFKSLGYQAGERWLLFRRDISVRADPFDARLVNIRRNMQITIRDRPSNASWWWMTRQGRLDALWFELLPKTGGNPVASMGCWGMELHNISRGQRTVGLYGLTVLESERRKGYAKALLLDVIRRLREERVTHVEIQFQESNEPALGLSRWLGFQQVDAGVVYRKSAK